MKRSERMPPAEIAARLARINAGGPVTRQANRARRISGAWSAHCHAVRSWADAEPLTDHEARQLERLRECSPAAVNRHHTRGTR